MRITYACIPVPVAHSTRVIFFQTENSVIENWQELEGSVAVTEDDTRRLALCNMDWDKITANDLFGKLIINNLDKLLSFALMVFVYLLFTIRFCKLIKFLSND